MTLKIRQIGVPGKGDQGQEETMYASCKVPGKVHIIVPATSIHIDIEDFKKMCAELFPVEGAKHGGTL